MGVQDLGNVGCLNEGEAKCRYRCERKDVHRSQNLALVIFVLRVDFEEHLAKVIVLDEL